MKSILFAHPIRNLAVIVLVSTFFSCERKQETVIEQKPNVILIMTDDQGIGDFGFMGNPYVKTPNLDKLASQSLNLTNFYVGSVCAPTRSSLMTGRYSERTGIYDTYNGGATMSNEEITMAEVMKENGYETAIFGKWHLGDNYPYRPMDQGFNTSIVHLAGGIGQPGDVYNYFDGDSSYFDPVLFCNGEPVQKTGYCSDVFTNEIIKFIKEKKQEKPLFAFLSFNAPHTPLQLPEEYYNMYKDVEFDASKFAIFDDVVDKMTPNEIDAARRVYGMVTNIDDNIGKLIQTLKDEGIYNNTIIVFLSDNGPEHNRYKIGLRERKSSVFGGGVRVPCLIHYPGKYDEKSVVDATIAQIDLLPSLVDLCGLKKLNHKIDGQSIFSANNDYSAFENRTLFFEWGRGYLMKYRNFSALKGNYKLVGNTGSDANINDFEMFDVKTDPQEKHNIVSENIQVATELKNEMDAWYNEIIAEKNNNVNFPAYIGTPHENPVILNRNDAKGTPIAWTGDSQLNYWDVKSLEDGKYDIHYHFIQPIKEPGEIILKMYPYHFVEFCTGNVNEWTFKNIEVKKGDYMLQPYYKTKKGSYIFPFYVSVNRIDN